VINLTNDQTQWLLAFFAVVSGLLMYYALNHDKKIDKIRKDSKEKRNIIKKNMEVQNVRPLLIKIFSMCSSKIDFEDKAQFEKELESIIYYSETWKKLDSELRTLRDKMKEIAEVDNVFKKYMTYTSFINKSLFLFTFIIAAIIPVYVFGDLLAWIIWGIAVIQISCIICIKKWKASKAYSKFEIYEDIYIRQ